MSKRKQRIDSATAAVKVMHGATREIAPPAHVRMSAEDWPFWHSVIAEFARSEWTEIGRAACRERVCKYELRMSDWSSDVCSSDLVRSTANTDFCPITPKYCVIYQHWNVRQLSCRSASSGSIARRLR